MSPLSLGTPPGCGHFLLPDYFAVEDITHIPDLSLHKRRQIRLLGCQAPDTFQILRRVHASAWGLRSDVNGYPVAMPQGPQLFERLKLLHGRLGQLRKLAQKADPVGIDSDMAQWPGKPVLRPPRLTRQVAGCRNRRTAEIKGPLLRIQYHLDDIGIQRISQFINSVRGG